MEWENCPACKLLHSVVKICHIVSRVVGTGGVRGARAPPIFLRGRTKIRHKFCLFSLFLNIMHPLILAGCYDPGDTNMSGILIFLKKLKLYEELSHHMN